MDADTLYGLPLDRFVAERGALAKALRAGGKREEASAVAGLRKPSVAAWAVNQLVRTQSGAVDELFDAGDALRRSQADLLAGRGDARALRAASEHERAAVDALVQSARGLLSSEGHELSPAMVERVADTLHAAALDEDAREQVRHGRLERELRHVGLGLGLGESPFAAAAPDPSPSLSPSRTKARTKSKATVAEAAEERRRVEEERAEAERVERERAAAREVARAAETSARRRTERAARALKAAEERHERAAAALEDADQALADAREEAEEAAEAHRRAQTELERI